MSTNGLIVEILFRSIFHKVLHSTIDFVWSTPVGKIVNRFSKDMDETDIVRLLILLNWRMTRMQRYPLFRFYPIPLKTFLIKRFVSAARYSLCCTPTQA